MLPADVGRFLQERWGRVGSSSRIARLQVLRMIFPSVGVPCKFRLRQILEEFPAELQGEVAQRDAADQIYGAEKSRRDKFASPRDQSRHDEGPDNRAE